MPLEMFRENNSAPLDRIKTIIGVAAGKGGVGKSTVAATLARASEKRGIKTGLLDADIYGPSIRRLIPEEQMPMRKGEIIIPARSGAIQTLSMAYFRQDENAAVVRAPIANGIIKQFLHQVDWGDLDILIIDFPPGTGDIQLTLAQEAKLSGAVMVTTPQQLATLDVQKAIHMFAQVGVPVLGVIENMSYYQQGENKVRLFGEGGGQKLADESGVPFLGEIPIHPAISQCGDRGVSLFEEKIDDIHHAFERCLTQILESVSPSEGGIGYGFHQVDPHTFALKSPEGESKVFRLSQLQKKCPCAGCLDEETGMPLIDPDRVDNEVKATRVDRVGHYGLKIHFTSGCSNGIYTFDALLAGHYD